MTIIKTPHTSARTAVFETEGHLPATVRVVVDDSGVSGAVSSGPIDVPSFFAFPPSMSRLLVAEALQFSADIVAEHVEGRATPFVRSWMAMANDVHMNAKAKGFWEEGVDRNDGELLALIHSEVSETLEALRNGNPPDSKLPEFTAAEVELADVVIRVMDMGAARGWRIAQAIEAKAAYNTTRPHKHGKTF